MSVQEFIDDLGLDLAAEQVGENPDLPPELAFISVHFALEIVQYNPYQVERFVISTPSRRAVQQPHPYILLMLMAMILNDWRDCSDPIMWAHHYGLPDVSSLDHYLRTFAHDEERLMRLFGEDFERFLALDPRREA